MNVAVLGAGQLGRMLGLAGIPLGLRFRFLDESADVPAAAVGTVDPAGFRSPEAIDRLADWADVATYEFENVPVEAVRRLAERVPVRPSALALETSRDRLAEKTFFRRLGIPTPAFAPIDSPGDVPTALAEVGLPAVVKTRRLGYDGKGQAVVRAPGDAEGLWERLGGVPLIAEAFVPFDREASILAVRGLSGETAFYPLTENVHRDGILRTSRAPAPDSAQLQVEAERHALAAIRDLDYVGVLAIEFFVADGRLLANETAPRVHNSGHWTIEGAETSQFENHLRAILGLPLGSTSAKGFAGMVNLIGDAPPRETLLRAPGVRLHLYDKAPRPGRKIGHATFVGTRESVERGMAELGAQP